LQNKPGKPVTVFPAEFCLKVQVLHICGLTQFLFAALVPRLEQKLLRDGAVIVVSALLLSSN